jgi:hypothetical protein
MDKGLYDCTVSYQLLTKLSFVLIYAPQATNDIKCVGFDIRSSYENSKNPVDGVREKLKQASRNDRRRCVLATVEGWGRSFRSFRRCV